MRYLIVVTAAGHRLTQTTFALEGAFCEHLRVLKQMLGSRFSEIVVAMGDMTERDYQLNKESLSVIDEEKDHIRFVPVFSWHATRARFALEMPAMLLKLAALVKDSDLVHSHLSYDLFRPVEVSASVMAVALRKKLISITDMDNRKDADMNLQLGKWTKRSWATCTYLYDPVRDAQQRAYVKLADLVLFKELQQVEDYGRGAPHVRLFLDPNFSPSQIADQAVLKRKVHELEDPKAPLRVLYFGRLVPYKGVDKMIAAVASAKRQGANLRFDIMGLGPEAETLKAQVRELGVEDIVSWIAPRPYGEAFFEVLRERHLLLACPLGADTPRSTWDALASAMPVLAFDTPFYSGMGKYTGAVDVVPWPDVDAVATRLVSLARDKSQLVPMAQKAVAAARANTGDAWMKRRVEWVEELFTPPSKSA